MLLLLSAGRRLAACALAGLAGLVVYSQPTFPPQQGEYSITKGLPGDQSHPQLSLTPNGGYVVWQDYLTDGDGLGITARALNNSLSPVVAKSFRVNGIGAGDQENAVVQMLPDGSAVFAWQGGAQGSQNIYARVISAQGIFVTGDVQVNTYTNGTQVAPAIAALSDGSVIVVWSSWEQDGSLQGVYGRRLSASGAFLGDAFQVNQFTPYNQRSAAVAALDGGGFVVAWVSEQERFQNSVDVFARKYDGSGSPLGNEFLVNTTTNICANPAVLGTGQGAFVLAWSQEDIGNLTQSWDVMVRPYGADGLPLAQEQRANQYTVGPQFGPKIARIKDVLMLVWTSFWQDGDREGIYGRCLKANGNFLGDEFLVNTTTASQQIQPALASDGGRRVLAVWASYVGSPAAFEILAQRYSTDPTLTQPPPPFVSALGASSLLVAWPELAGYTNSVGYQVYMDGSAVPVVTTNNYLVVKTDNSGARLAPSSSHNFRLAYALVGGVVSVLSDAATGRTWGPDDNNDGLPDDWQAKYWGPDPSKWPSPNADSDGDGASNLQEFLAGTDPTDPQSVLRLQVQATSQGVQVSWNTQPGSVYQLQASGNLTDWASAGPERFAPGLNVSTVVPPGSGSTYYRVIRIR